MPKTALLPTVTAVRMVWAMTGKFSDDEASSGLERKFCKEFLAKFGGRC